MNNNIKQHYIVEDTKIMDEVVISWIITHSSDLKNVDIVLVLTKLKKLHQKTLIS